MGKFNLPKGWLKASLDDVLISIVGGGTPAKSNAGYFQGSIPWMSVKDMNKNTLDDTVDHITQEAVDNSSTNVIPAGTPIVATRMSLGKIVVANFDSAINQDLKALYHADGIERDYLVNWYRSQSKKIESLGTGTTVKGIRLEVLKTLEFPLPPKAEQKIIAAKLDTLLAQVETTKVRLERIPAILKTFRQSVLAAAVSGKLTEEWRGPSEYVAITESLFAPVVWKKVTIDSLAQNVTSGSRGWAPYYSDEGSLFIRSQDINNDELNIDGAAYVSLPENIEGKRTKVVKGDLLITITGANVTKCARVKVELESAYISQHVALVRLEDDSLSSFVEWALKAKNAGRKQLTEMAYGGGKPGLNLTNVRAVEFSIPSKDEQAEIARRVEELFTFSCSVEQKTNAALERVNNLTQSILAKAFKGELTADWRAANPELISGENSAEALLENIKIERESIRKQPKPQRTSVKRNKGSRMSRKIIKVADALKEAGKPLSGQQLLAAAGYPSDSSTDQLERFFLEIREAMTSEKSIVKLKRDEDGQDWFTLPEIVEAKKA